MKRVESPDFLLVEGAMGVGKSGVAQAMERMMRSGSVPCRWFFEMDPNNPVGRDNDPTLPSETIRRSAVQWRRFIDRWDAPPTAVVDGRLFNVNVAISLMEGRSSSDIIADLTGVMETFRNRKAFLIHLYSSDVRRLLHRTLSTRNDTQWFADRVKSSEYGSRNGGDGLDLAVQLLEQQQSTTEELVQSFPGEVMAIDVDSLAWDEIIEGLAERFGLSSECLRVAAPPGLTVEGEYWLNIGSESTKVAIRRAGSAYLLANHPFSRFGGADDPFTLLPEADGQFIFRSAPVVLVPREREGVVQEIAQRAWYGNWESAVGRFVRIDD